MHRRMLSAQIAEPRRSQVNTPLCVLNAACVHSTHLQQSRFRRRNSSWRAAAAGGNADAHHRGAPCSALECLERGRVVDARPGWDAIVDTPQVLSKRRPADKVRVRAKEATTENGLACLDIPHRMPCGLGRK